MNQQQLLDRVRSGDTTLTFNDVLATIDAHWAFTPVAFRNGTVENGAGENIGSCKVLAFAALHSLDQDQTLLLFAEHYQAVLAEPDGSAHANIRAFMASGWEAFSMDGRALVPANREGYR